MGLTQWLILDTSDHWLHLLTFISLFLIAIGFFYVSYEVLSKPQGVLRWILIIFTHIGLSIGTSLVLLYPLILFFTKINIHPIICTTNSEGINNTAGIPELILDVFVFTLMIGSLQGILTARLFSHGENNNKIRASNKTKNANKNHNFMWADCFIGVVFSLAFFYIDDYIVFPTCTLHDAFLTIPDLIQFIVLGAFGSGFWRRYSHRNSHQLSEDIHPTEEDWQTYYAYNILYDSPKPISLFSGVDSIQGFIYWLLFGFLSFIMWLISESLLGANLDWVAYQLDAAIGIVSISLTCGISRYITRKLFSIPEKLLGIIGAIITVIGFIFGFIEPLLLFARAYLH